MKKRIISLYTETKSGVIYIRGLFPKYVRSAQVHWRAYDYREERLSRKAPEFRCEFGCESAREIARWSRYSGLMHHRALRDATVLYLSPSLRRSPPASPYHHLPPLLSPDSFTVLRSFLRSAYGAAPATRELIRLRSHNVQLVSGI